MCASPTARSPKYWLSLPVEASQSWLDVPAVDAVRANDRDHRTQEHATGSSFSSTSIGYLSLNRAACGRSPGSEAQRIALANSLGSRLVDTLYVLDEPSIELHPRDIDRLLRLLMRLRDAGNTVLVVEHDLEAVRHADYMVELGPGSGDNSGRIMFSGPISTGRRVRSAFGR